MASLNSFSRLLLLIILCVYALGIDPISSKNSERSLSAHHLNLVYGSERIDLHFPSHSEFEQAIHSAHLDQGSFGIDTHRSLSTTEADDSYFSAAEVLSQLVCVLYSSGALAKEALTTIFGGNYVSTVHVSESDDRVCFLVVCTPEQLQQVMVDTSSSKSFHFDLNAARRIDFV
jgi:hypothetical protein